jgi:hypothetical protein
VPLRASASVGGSAHPEITRAQRRQPALPCYAAESDYRRAPQRAVVASSSLSCEAPVPRSPKPVQIGPRRYRPGVCKEQDSADSTLHVRNGNSKHTASRWFGFGLLLGCRSPPWPSHGVHHPRLTSYPDSGSQHQHTGRG